MKPAQVKDMKLRGRKGGRLLRNSTAKDTGESKKSERTNPSGEKMKTGKRGGYEERTDSQIGTELPRSWVAVGKSGEERGAQGSANGR